MAKIGAEFNLSAARVCSICKAVEKWLLKNTQAAVIPIKMQHTRRLEEQLDKALAEYDRSREDAEVEKIVNEVDFERDEQGNPLIRNGRPVIREIKSSRIEKTKSGRLGDPRYLEQARKCLTDIRKIWGAEEPEKHETKITQNNVVVYIPDNGRGDTTRPVQDVIDAPRDDNGNGSD